MIFSLSFNRPALGSGGTYPVPNSYGVGVGNERLYDVWGGVRGGQKFGYPNHRYCANLGHKVDDETGLIYMRARYYEPSTGRFISEDPMLDGVNWYIYGRNNPVSFNDFSGGVAEDSNKSLLVNLSVVGILLSLSRIAYSVFSQHPEVRILAISGLAFLAGWFNFTMAMGDTLSLEVQLLLGGTYLATTLAVTSAVCTYMRDVGRLSPTAKAIDVFWLYSSILSLFISLTMFEENYGG